MISVLFVSKNSVYKSLGVDCWDEDRNALNWPGGNPGIFHPPCRLFCRLSHMSTAPREEKHLAYWSVDMVRIWGGVLEHPAYSKLWKDVNLPKPGQWDDHGFTVGLDQFCFGHPAQKRTWLYICGTKMKDLPGMPLRMGYPEDIFAGGSRKYVNGSRHSGIRSATTFEFARWLIQVAKRCGDYA